MRQYQTTALREVYKKFRDGANSVLLCKPAGSGKTRVAIEATNHALKVKKRVLEISHRDFLRKQFQENLSPDLFGIIQGNEKPDYSKPVQIATVQTLKNREFPDADLVIFDEAHHCTSQGYQKIKEHYLSKGSKILGLSATPTRLDGKPLSRFFEEIVVGVSSKKLIDLGFLVPCRIFEKYTPNLSGVSKSGSDWNQKELSQAVNTISSNSHIVQEYERICPGSKSLIFSVNIKHGHEIKEAFGSRFRVEVLSSKTKINDRLRILGDFSEGKLDSIINCNILTEGYDLPAVETVILARPTCSLSLYIQMCARAMRPAPEKEFCNILDLSGNREKHGRPEEDHDWEWMFHNGRDKANRVADIPSKTCKKCFANCSSGVRFCPYCGSEFQTIYDRLSSLEILDLPLRELVDEFEKNEEEEHMRIKRLVASVRGYNWKWANYDTNPVYYQGTFSRIVKWEAENNCRLNPARLKNEELKLRLDNKWKK